MGDKITMFSLPQDYHLDYAKRNEYIESIQNNLTKFEFVLQKLNDGEQKKHLLELVSCNAGVLKHFFAYSPYLSDIITKHPKMLLEIELNGYDHCFQRLLEDNIFMIYQKKSQQELMAALRILKQKVSLLIALADITKHWSLEQVTKNLSMFAEKCVQTVSCFLLYDAAKKNEIVIPDAADPEQGSGLVVIAMGKLGAGELNYSSDIDLIIFFDEKCCEYKGRKTVKHFFVTLANNLAKILTERTQEGYVFRTDLRLRPDPMANPVAISLISAEHYYENLGQNWERAAMIKARTIAGDVESCKKFTEFIQYFIWRKSLDFASLRDIHSIKRQIDYKMNEGPESLLSYNVKLGKGGIREIEFFAQTQQLIWGGRFPQIRHKNTCDAICALVEIQQVEQRVAVLLTDAYHFLRKTEHRLQMLEDQQTHTLPANDTDFGLVSDFMGFYDKESFERLLEQKTQSVKFHYFHLFEAEPSLASTQNVEGNLVFTGAEDDPETLKTLTGMGFKNPAVISSMIRGWHYGRRRATRTKQAREVLTELMPTLLSAFAEGAYSDKSLNSFDEFLDRIPSGIQIFSLFYSNPSLLTILVEILGMYPYLAHNLNRQPSLLDYVVSPEFYVSLPGKKRLRDNLHLQLEEAQDLEDALDITRDWTNDRRFRVAVHYIKGITDPETMALNLSDIADVSTSMLMDLIYTNFQKRYGCIQESNFAILAFGKLGGQELTFNSDLDLVFLYRADESSVSDGETSLDVNTYFTRLARRFTNYVTTMTRAGTLYDIDLRLRPSGNDGPIASSFDAFIKYYNESAWMWEYMALTKTRCIYSRNENRGNDFVEDIDNKIREILLTQHPRNKLMTDLIDMHKKTVEMKKTNNPFNLKYHRGGSMDVEYITQTLLLLYAPKYQEILHNNTLQALCNLRSVIPEEEDRLNILIEAYNFYRALLSYLRLTGNNRPLEKELSRTEKKLLAQHTDQKDFKSLKNTLIKTQEDVLEIFNHFMQ